jgi:hypothetical protein
MLYTAAALTLLRHRSPILFGNSLHQSATPIAAPKMIKTGIVACFLSHNGDLARISVSQSMVTQRARVSNPQRRFLLFSLVI